MSSSGKNVLVAIIPNKRDFKILTNQLWYRIPVKSAPKKFQFDYIAFYLPKVFGEEKWQIKYYAEVKDITIVKRKELLPDEPLHPRANEPYFKVNLTSLKELSNPIKSNRGRRIVFIRTTWEKLRTAKEINDLFNTSKLEEKLYQAMRKEQINPERQYFVEVMGKFFALDFALFCRKGKIDIECDGDRYHSDFADIVRDSSRNNLLTSQGWHILRFRAYEINRYLSECLELIKKTSKILGGELVI